MNFLRNSVTRIHALLSLNTTYSCIGVQRSFSLFEQISKTQQPILLKTQSPLLEQVCGFKVKYKLQKRCKDCYLVVRDGRKYIMCPTHRRHKQMSMVKKPKYTWIISYACQSKEKPW